MLLLTVCWSINCWERGVSMVNYDCEIVFLFSSKFFRVFWNLGISHVPVYECYMVEFTLLVLWNVSFYFWQYSLSWCLFFVDVNIVTPVLCLLFAWSFSSIYLFRVSISLLTLPICYCMLPTFLIRALNILIIVTLNSLFDNSSICHICLILMIALSLHIVFVLAL